MVYTASDAIDLVYRMIGKISATNMSSNQDITHIRLLSMDIKELYRNAIKNKVKIVSEFDNLFNNYSWTALDPQKDKEELQNIKSFVMKYFFVTNDENYFLDRQHVSDELKKIYDIALENTFIVDKSEVNWNNTIRNIESRFLYFLKEKGIHWDSDMKTKFQEIVTSFNSKEEVSYQDKADVIISLVKQYGEFADKYKSDASLQTMPNIVVDYELFKEALQESQSLELPLEEYVNYDSIVKAIDALPDDMTDYDLTKAFNITRRVFMAQIISTDISSSTTSRVNPKLTMIRNNGGWKIDIEKPEIRNLFVSLTYDETMVKKMIQIGEKQLNNNTIDVALVLIELALSKVAPEKFVNIENNLEFDIPNNKVIEVFMSELNELVNYHEQGGVIETIITSSRLPANPNTRLFSVGRANEILDFEHMSNIISALKTVHYDIKDFPDTVIMRTVKFISKLGEIAML